MDTPENRHLLARIAELTAERDEATLLVRDLANVLACTVVGWESIIGEDLAQAPEVKRVMARYRAWRDHSPSPVTEACDD